MHHRGVRRRTEKLGGESKVEGWGAEGRGADASTGDCLLNIGQYEAPDQQKVVGFQARKNHVSKLLRTGALARSGVWHNYASVACLYLTEWKPSMNVIPRLGTSSY